MPRMRRVTNRGGVREGAGRQDDGESYSAERRRIIKLKSEMAKYDYLEVAKAFMEHTETRRGETFAAVVGMTLFRPGSYRRVLVNEEEAACVAAKFGLTEAKELEPTESLSILLYQRLSKRSYMYIRSTVNAASEAKILPSYDQTVAAKLDCRPQTGIVITEVKATVSVRSIIEHTLKRILELLGADVDMKLIQTRRKIRACKFIFSYGYDAATGYKMHKQAFRNAENADRSDASHFAAAFNPLTLCEDGGSSIWLNPVPQSPLFVRPFWIELQRETPDFVRQVRDEIQRQMDECPDLLFETPGGKTLRISIRPVLSMIDGKVFNILTDTTSFDCPTCLCPAREFNNLANVGTVMFQATEEGLIHGCQPLHAWINFVRHLFNVSYNKPVWAARARGAAAAEIRASKKREVQAAFLPYGLRIDFPAPNGRGSSMDGNTSRRALRMHQRFAEICDLNPDLVRRYWIILICVNNTHWKLKVEAFRAYCMDTYRLYIQEYSWYRLSPTVHKVLFHAADMQERLELPIGCYNEGALETTHRMRKDFRDRCTRQNSHLNKNTDVFNRCLDVSDPIIADKIVRRASMYRKTEEQILKDMPMEAQNLLEIPGRPAYPPQPGTDNDRSHSVGRNNGRGNVRAGVHPVELEAVANNGLHQNAQEDIAPDAGFMLGAMEDEEEVIFNDIEPEHDYVYRSDDEPMDEN